MSTSVPPPLPRISQLARASLVLGILSGLFLPVIASIPGVICGHLAFRALRRDPSLLGHKMAKAGLVLNYLSLAGTLFLWLLWTMMAPTISDLMPMLQEMFPVISN